MDQTLATARRRGRPTVFTPEVLAEIRRRLKGGESIRRICADPHLPCPSAVWRRAQHDPELGAALSRWRTTSGRGAGRDSSGRFVRGHGLGNGLPTKLDPAIEAEICLRLAGDEPLVWICEDPHMPHVQTVYRWARENPAFRAAYDQARIDQGETVADKLAVLRRQIEDDAIEPAAAHAIARLACWEASRRLPWRYGDKLALREPDPPGPQYDLGRLSAAQREALEELVFQCAAPEGEEEAR